MGNKFTIKDVSRRAGVSVTTVSLVLNNKEGVGEETRRRVLQTIEEMNFTPNRLAQGLITRKTQIISVVVATNEFNDLINPFFIEIINQVSLHLQDSPYKMMLNVIRQKDERKYYTEELDSPGADAYIVFGSRIESGFFAEAMTRTGVPLLLVNRQLVPEPLSSVSPDNFKGGYLIANHLIRLGHRDLAFIGRMPGVNAPEMREQGFLLAARESGLTIREEWLIEARYDQLSGYTGFKELWTRCRQSGRYPSAVFAGNDAMALGAIEAARELKLRLPEELSLTGFDGVMNVHLIAPSLTTVQIDFREMGAKIVRKTLQMVEGEQREPEQLVVDVKVKERESTRPYMSDR